MNDVTSRWVESTPATNNELTQDQVKSWREQGFTLVHDLLPTDVLRACKAEALDFFPAPGTQAASEFTQFGSDQRFVFPALSESCNQITLHPNLLQAIARLLDTNIVDLRLTQSDLWPKYGRPPSNKPHDNADQRIHCDYPNHMLTHPPPWDSPEAVELIIYLNEEAQSGGATAVVPRQGDRDPAYPWPIVQTPGVAGMRYVNDRASAEAYLDDINPEAAAFRESNLYARECHARFKFGSVLLYRHDTWHRGTPLKPDTMRLVLNMTFKKANRDWINVLHPGWSWSMYRPDQFMEKLVARASVEQRCVLGFPAPDSPYWNEATIEAVAARYGAHGIDMSPYRDAVGSP